MGTDAHFEAALAAALKETEGTPDLVKEATEAKPAPTDPAKIQEAETAQADKAKEDEAVKAKAEADEVAAKAKADETKEPNPAGVIGKARRLFNEGKVKEAVKLALGVDLEQVELSGKTWRGIKHHAEEREREAEAVKTQAQQEVAQAQQVVRTLDPFIKGAQAYLQGDFETFLKLTTGDTPESFQRKLIGQLHEAPKADPALLARLEAVERERQAERAAAEEYRRKYEETEKRRAYEQQVTSWKHSVTEELKGSVFAKVATKPAFVEKIFALQEQYYNPKTKLTIDTLDAAELVWDELYGDVVPAVATSEKVDNTGRPGKKDEVPTTVKHTQTNEAAPTASLPWSPENQEKILEEWARKAKSEALQASLL